MKGLELARAALEIYGRRGKVYPDGIIVDDLERELRLAGVSVDGDNTSRALADALNASQVDGVWARQDGAAWLTRVLEASGAGCRRPSKAQARPIEDGAEDARTWSGNSSAKKE